MDFDTTRLRKNSLLLAFMFQPMRRCYLPRDRRQPEKPSMAGQVRRSGPSRRVKERIRFGAWE